MNQAHVATIARELKLMPEKVNATATLLEEGATVPFIARYRKEATGSLDEVVITNVRDRLEQLAELDQRREAIVKSLVERELLSNELKQKLEAAKSLAILEDLYLPYRPKRRTRATIARERGLEPLARVLFNQDPAVDPAAEASSFVDEKKSVASIEDALAGARDIIAERVSEDVEARRRMRSLFSRKGLVVSKVAKGKEEPDSKFRDYFDWSEPIGRAPSHRVLALLRGEREKVLSLKLAPPDDEAVETLERLFVRGPTAASEQVRSAVADGYKRLLGPSIATEVRLQMKERADAEAIKVFAGNLRELLLAAPAGARRVLAIDPGFRTGCKVACLDRQGRLLHHETINPHVGGALARQAPEALRSMCERYEIELVAVGNGTAGRETEAFARGLDLPGSPAVVMVDESGASIYSASKVAREEFPDHDLTVRGSVSIGRRLMDPLAELVKIDPKSIGVGQYQHDVDQAALKKGLDDVVSSCVNAVGVAVNTASKELLTYVSGLGPRLAQNVVAYRDEHGPFRSRAQLKKVPRLGPKAFEQAAGFLRVTGANPLDRSAVHPESYHVVKQMAKGVGVSVQGLMDDAALQARVELTQYQSDKVGLPTLLDVMEELTRPGRDPRDGFEVFSFDEGVRKLEDLKPGMKLPGIVTNVTNFGAFVDVGVHQDGLVHVSQLADRFVRDPAEVVKVRQQVDVTVLEVDVARKRVSLSMKSAPEVKA